MGAKKKILIVIPARWKSKRFIGKPLAKIMGKPVLKHVWLKCIQSKKADNVVVATDNFKIKQFCQKENMDVIMTSSKHLTGTDRVSEVSKKIYADIYVNVQGDEPLIDPKNIDIIVNSLIKKIPRGFSISTGYEITNIGQNKKKSKNFIVKSKTNRLIFITRSEIPSNYKKKENRLMHIGLFAFTKEALKKFSSYKIGVLEKNESNELLRLVENDENIFCVPIKNCGLAVDYPSDISKIETFIKKKKIKIL